MFCQLFCSLVARFGIQCLPRVCCILLVYTPFMYDCYGLHCVFPRVWILQVLRNRRSTSTGHKRRPETSTVGGREARGAVNVESIQWPSHFSYHWMPWNHPFYILATLFTAETFLIYHFPTLKPPTTPSFKISRPQDIKFSFEDLRPRICTSLETSLACSNSACKEHLISQDIMCLISQDLLHRLMTSHHAQFNHIFKKLWLSLLGKWTWPLANFLLLIKILDVGYCHFSA